MVRAVFDLPDFNAKALQKKEAFLRLYQVIRLDKVSRKQKTKFMTAVQAPYLGTASALSQALDAVEKGLERLLDRVDPVAVNLDAAQRFRPLRLWPPNDKRAPVVLWEEIRRAQPGPLRLPSLPRRDIRTFNFVNVLAFDPDWNDLWKRYPREVSLAMVGPGKVIPVQVGNPYLMRDIPAGNIGFIQEGGAKLRSVANPLLAIQALGELLKRRLEAITRRLPQIGTFDQSSSHDTIVRWIQAGREVASFDLASFTDRFPFVLQERVLELLHEWRFIHKFDLEVVRTTVKKTWMVPATGEQVRWVVGQPLGFGPSFHLATLTHAALLRGLGRSKLFRVVGDDVAIADSLLARRYSDLITGLGIEISTSKSIISREYAEFCGKLLTKWGVNPSIKVKLITGADQLVRTLAFYGPRGLSFLSPRERKWLLKVFLPEDLGGLGWTPPNIPYKTWLNVLDRDRVALHRIRSDLREYLGSPVASWNAIVERLLAFDEENDLERDPLTVSELGLTLFGITSIAASNRTTVGLVEGPSVNYGRMTFVDLIDEAARMTLQKSKLLPPWMVYAYTNTWGYINPRQKEPRLPMPNFWSEQHEQSDSNCVQFFQPNARFW